MSIKLKQPEELDFHVEGEKGLAERWKAWRETMELFLNLSMPDKTENAKYSAVLYIIGQHGRDIHNTWEVQEGDRNVETLLNRFENYCNPKTNVTLERFKFNTRSQESHETIDEYVTVLRKLSKNCNFGQLTEDLIKDRVVVGISSQIIKERLLAEADLTLERALCICRADEESKKGLRLMGSEKVDVVKACSYKGQKQKPPGKQTSKRKPGETRPKQFQQVQNQKCQK